MMSGNAGDRTTSAGRSPMHEIGQFRNVMMQMVKDDYEFGNRIWLAVPDSLNQLPLTGEGNFWDVQQYKWVNKDLYLNMGSGVFVAIKPYPAPLTLEVNTGYTESVDHSALIFGWSPNVLGTLVTEVATTNDYADFASFVNAMQTKTITAITASTSQYTSGSNNTIQMEYVEPGTFMMTPFTYDTPYTNPLSPAGSYPKVWGNGNYIDYTTWDSYKTVYGHDLVNQAWGSGVMTLKTAEASSRTTIDPVTAEVKFEVNKVSSNSTSIRHLTTQKSTIHIYPNPVKNELFVKSDQPIKSLSIYNSIGVLVSNYENVSVIPTANLPKGIYFLKIRIVDAEEVKKFIKN
jgi:hypothetical protein